MTFHSSGKRYLPLPAKLLRIMRITATILLIASLHVSAKTSGQTVTFSGHDVPLVQVFKVIEKQTGYVFFYQATDLQNAKPVTIELKKTGLLDALNTLVQGQNLKYSVESNTIFITAVAPAAQSPSETPPPIDIHGRIVNEDGDPVVGASVKIKGTNIGTSTDANGDFVLNSVDESAVLIISATNIESLQVSVKGKKNLDIQAKKKETALEDVIVNKGPYSTTQKLNTGNTFKVTGKEIQQQPVSDPIAALEGRVPGLYISQTSGMPGSSFTVRLRGQNSIYDPNTKLGTVNDPLYIIDGVPYSSQSLTNSYYGGGAVGTPTNSQNNIGQGLSPFNNIDPSDIESIEVLKDADGTAIYGSRGANGVVLITTKKGKAGATKVDLNIFNGWGKVKHHLDLLNTQQYIMMRHEALRNDGITTPGQFDYDLNGVYDTSRYTDWQKVLIGNTASYTNAQLNISGGNNNTQFLIGGSYGNQTTVFPGDYHDIKASVHLNVTHRSKDGHFLIQSGVAYTNDNNQLPQTDLTKQIVLAPDAPAIYDAFGNLNWQLLSNGSNTWVNPLAYTQQQAIAVSRSLISNLSIGYRLLPDLTLKSNFGYTRSQMDQNLITLSTFSPPAQRSPTSRSNIVATNSIETWIIEPQIVYNKAIGKNNFDATIGSQVQQNTNNASSINFFGFTSDALVYNVAGASNVARGANSTIYTLYKYNAAYARLGYNWGEKYVLNLTGRRDGSSRFGTGRQFGNFWAVGGAWLFSKERFIENTLRCLSFGKLRLSYGTTGNDQIQDYNYLSTYSPSSTSYQGFTILNPTRLTNPFIGWEEVKKAEIGLELGLFKNRVYTTVSYYRNRTVNQLVGEPLSGITGFTSILVNLPATIQNSGVEFVMHTVNIKSKNFTWTSDFNTTLPKNKLVAFQNLAGSSYANTYFIGKSIFIAKLNQYAGVDPMTGLYTFKTKSGNSSQPTYPNDVVFKDLLQNLFGGLGNSFTYKGWSLDLFIEMIRQTGRSYLSSFNPPGLFYTTTANQPVDVLNRWQHPGDKASIQRFSTTSPATTLYNNLTGSDLLYRDNEASFIRLKNLSLSYQLPKGWQRSAHLQGARLYLQCQNLFTITKFKGLDPETGGALTLPPLRMITLGAQLTL